MRKLLVVLILLFLAVILGLWRTGPRAKSPATVATEYVKALQSKDRKTITRLTHDIDREIAAIKAKNPQALWQKLIAAHDARLAKETEQRLDDDTIACLTPGASWKIVKSKAEGDATVVSLDVTYPKFEDSPYVFGHFLEATLFQVTVTSSNLVQNVTRAGFYRSTVSLMVFTASWAQGLGGLTLRATAVGGNPPYSWSAECGSVKFPGQDRNMGGMGILGPDEARFRTMDLSQFNSEPVPCMMTVTDASGNIDQGHFMVPKIETPGRGFYCFARSPWVNRGLKDGPDCIGGTLLPITGAESN